MLIRLLTVIAFIFLLVFAPYLVGSAFITYFNIPILVFNSQTSYRWGIGVVLMLASLVVFGIAACIWDYVVNEN